nr:lyase family protein [Oenococcus oeni]
MKLWGGPFTKGEDADMTSFDNSLPTSKLLYKEDIQGSIAHAKMLGKQNIISQKESAAIVDGLKEILTDVEQGSLIIPDSGYEDIHSFIETTLTKKNWRRRKKTSHGPIT